MLPNNINKLNNLLQESYPTLSKKMKLIAFYIIDQPQKLALNTLSVIAEDIGVYPSTLVRFAKHYGFSGFTEIQELFKVKISQSAINYHQRITDVKKVTVGDVSTNYNPYSTWTTESVEKAKKLNATVILLTDTKLNPIAHLADYLFCIHEAEIHTFRSLGATMCLVQAICISIGYHQQGN